MSDILTHDGLGPFDPYWTDDVQPPRRSWRGRVILGMIVAAGLVGAALLFSTPSGAPTTLASAAATVALSETVDPNLPPLFTFEAEDGRQAEYEARVVPATGDRRDLYSVGVLGGGTLALRLEAFTQAKAAPAGSLFVAIAEEAAAFGAAVERLEASHILATAQGPVEWSELTLAGLQRSCAGFRLVGHGHVGLRGLACAAPGAKIDAAAVSCLIDGVTLTQAGRDAGLGAVLKGPDVRRPGCRVVVSSR